MVVSSHLISPSYNHCNNYREINSIAPHPNQKFQKCLGYSLIAIFTFRIIIQCTKLPSWFTGKECNLQ